MGSAPEYVGNGAAVRTRDFPSRAWSDFQGRYPQWASDVGSRARVRQPRLPAVVWTVTAVETGRYFEWQNVRPGLKTVAGHRVETRASNGTRVTPAFRWSGLLAPLIRLLYGKLSGRYVEMEAQGLKRRCETL